MKHRKFLHVNDNVSRNNLENSNDKLFKVRALLDLVTNNSKKIGPEKTHSIDEQIIPAKTKRSGGVKQYNPKKNSLVGFQEFGESRSIWDRVLFFFCVEQNDVEPKNHSSIGGRDPKKSKISTFLR